MRRWSLLLLILASLSGCASPGDNHRAQLADMIHEVVTPERAERLKFQAEMRRLLEQQQYASLVRIADSLRTNRARFRDGHYALVDFYDSFSLDETPKAKDSRAWQTSIAQLQAWRSAMPETPLPDVMLAATYGNLAWKSRGGGYAFTVSDTGWAGYGNALQHARDALDEAATKRPLGIEWYLVSSRVALGMGWSSRQSQELFAGAVALDSTCENAYILRSTYLLPRWYGRKGEWQQWLDRSLAPLPPEEATRIYAAVGSSMTQIHRDFFRETGYDWRRMRHGHVVQIDLHPRSQALAQQIAYDAVQAGDAGAAHEMFSITGPRCDLKIWRSKRYFTDCYLWAQARDARVRVASAR